MATIDIDPKTDDSPLVGSLPGRRREAVETDVRRVDGSAAEAPDQQQPDDDERLVSVPSMLDTRPDPDPEPDRPPRGRQDIEALESEPTGTLAEQIGQVAETAGNEGGVAGPDDTPASQGERQVVREQSQGRQMERRRQKREERRRQAERRRNERERAEEAADDGESDKRSMVGRATERTDGELALEMEPDFEANVNTDSLSALSSLASLGATLGGLL